MGSFWGLLPKNKPVETQNELSLYRYKIAKHRLTSLWDKKSSTPVHLWYDFSVFVLIDDAYTYFEENVSESNPYLITH